MIIHFHFLYVKVFNSDLFTFTFYIIKFQMVTRTKKIFVGGLSAPSTLEDVKNYFEQFGRVSLGIFLIKITSNSVWTKSYLTVVFT